MINKKSKTPKAPKGRILREGEIKPAKTIKNKTKYYQVYIEYIDTEDFVVKANSKEEALKEAKRNLYGGHITYESCDRITKKEYKEQGGE